MKEHQPRRERKPLPTGDAKVDQELSIEGFDLEDSSVTYFRRDPNSKILQEENARIIVESAKDDEERERLQEFVDQELGKKPINYIPGIDGP